MKQVLNKFVWPIDHPCRRCIKYPDCFGGCTPENVKVTNYNVFYIFVEDEKSFE